MMLAFRVQSLEGRGELLVAPEALRLRITTTAQRDADQDMSFQICRTN